MIFETSSNTGNYITTLCLRSPNGICILFLHKLKDNITYISVVVNVYLFTTHVGNSFIKFYNGLQATAPLVHQACCFFYFVIFICSQLKIMRHWLCSKISRLL